MCQKLGGHGILADALRGETFKDCLMTSGLWKDCSDF